MTTEADVERLHELHRKLQDDNRDDSATLSKDERKELRTLFRRRHKLNLSKDSISTLKKDIEAAALREVYLDDLIEAFEGPHTRLTKDQMRDLWKLLARFAPKGQEIKDDAERYL